MLYCVALSFLGATGKIRFFCEDETRIGLKTIVLPENYKTRSQTNRASSRAISSHLLIWNRRAFNGRPFFLGVFSFKYRLFPNFLEFDFPAV